MSSLSIPQTMNEWLKEWLKMQHFCNDATLFLCYYPEKSYHFVQNKSRMDCLGNQPSFCGKKLITPVTAKDTQNGQDYISVCGHRQKKSHWLKYTATQYRSAGKSLAQPISWCILFDGENISFDASLVIYINSSNIPPIMIINRTYEHQNLLLL